MTRLKGKGVIVVLFYNKDLFDQAGLAYPAAEWTWADAAEAAEELTESEAGVWGLYSPIQFWEFYKKAAQNGCRFFNEDKTAVTINSPACVEALETMVGFVAAGIMPSDADMGGVSDGDMFKAGQIAMDVTGIWMFAAFQDAPFVWDIQVEPGLQEHATHFFANAVSVFAATRHPQEAWEWAKFFTSSPEQYVHSYTLAAIYAGLRAADCAPVGSQPIPARLRNAPAVAEQVRRFVLERGVQGGHLVKSIRPGGASAAANPEWATAVDASLIGVTTPYRLLAPDEPLMQATVARIESDLHCPGGGVHRYLADTYYGGGEWVLLAAWLGWYYAEVDNREQAQGLLRWVEAQADGDGYLPEQVSFHLLAPDRYAEWEAQWGPVANPLLWSHAMYLILHRALDAVG